MDNIFTYLVAMPPKIHEFVTPCADGYSVYIDKNLNRESQESAFEHALRHIAENDFEKNNVQEIETIAHKEGKP